MIFPLLISCALAQQTFDPNLLFIYNVAPPPLDASVALVQLGASGKVLRQSPPAGWKETTFDDASWSAATLPYGYDRENSHIIFASGDAGSEVNNFLRFRFSLSPAALADAMKHNVMFDCASDNGVNVYINDNVVRCIFRFCSFACGGF